MGEQKAMISLQYDRTFQINFLAALLADDKFMAEASRNIHLTDFDLPACRLIFEIAREQLRISGSVPGTNIIMAEVHRVSYGRAVEYETSLQPEEYESVGYTLERLSYIQYTQNEVDYYKRVMYGFLSFMRMLRAQETSSGSAAEQIAAIVAIDRDLQHLTGGGIHVGSAMDAVEEEDPNVVRIGTGLRAVDMLTNFGLKRGEQGILMACTGIGKTTGFINFAFNVGLRGTNSLVITCENPAELIRGRSQAIAAHIPANKFTRPHSEWTECERARLACLTDPSYPLTNRMSIVDYSRKTPTMSDIERAILAWKSQRIEHDNETEDSCAIVYVDWLEKIDSKGVPGVDKNSNDSTRLERISEALAALGRKHNVITWTAAQGKPDAREREVLRLQDTAHAKSIHNPSELSLGLAKKAVDPQQQARDILTRDSASSASMPVSTGREMNFTLMKTRNSDATDRVVPLFQGDTLRFWDSKKDAEKANLLARTARDPMDIIFPKVASIK